MTNAKKNLRDYYLRSAEHASETARKWLNRFEAALQTLSTHPDRCWLAPENDVVPEEIYEFLFGKRTGTFRVLFTVTAFCTACQCVNSDLPLTTIRNDEKYFSIMP